MGLIDDVPGGIDVETGRIFIAGAGMGCLRLGIGRILPGVIAARRDWREVVDMVLVGWGARWLASSRSSVTDRRRIDGTTEGGHEPVPGS